MKKRIAIILAFVVAISMFGMIGSACTLPGVPDIPVDDINEVLATDILQAVKDLYKTITGKDMPPVIADKLNAELWAKLAQGTGYLGITTYVCDFIAEYTGIILPADTLAIAVKAAFMIYGLVA